MVSLWAEAGHKHFVKSGGINNVSGEVKLWHSMIQVDVDGLVLFKFLVKRVQVEQDVRRLAQDSRDFLQQLHGLDMLLHFASLADDKVAKQGQHMDRINNF